MDKNSLIKKYVVISLMVLSIMLIIPLIVQTILRPVGLWDYFTIWDVMGISTEDLYDNSSILQFIYNLFLGSKFIYRPFSMLFYYVFVRMFYGNFWILMLIKWATKFLTIYLLYIFNKKIKGGMEGYLVVFSFLLFHTCSFEVMTFSVDGFVALFAVALTTFIYSTYQKNKSFNIKHYALNEYLILLLLFTLLSGQKEITIVMLFTTLMLYTVACYSEKSWTTRLIPLYIITLFAAIRIVSIAFIRQGNNSTGKNIFLIKIIDSLKLIFEAHIAYGGIAVFIVLVFALSVFNFIKKKHVIDDIQYDIYLMVTILGMVIFNCISTVSLAPRYVIPICFLVGELLLIALKQYKRIISRSILLIMGEIIPIICLSDIYAQHLAYANQFEEQIILLNYIKEEKKENNDLCICVTGSDEVTERGFAGQELQRSIREFYGKLGNEWYEIPQYEVCSIDQYIDGNQYSDALWITTFGVDDANKLLSNKKIDQVYQAYADVKVLRDLYDFSLKCDRFLKLPSKVAYDVGACVLSDEPYWNVYRITSKDEGEISQKAQYINCNEWNLENYTENIQGKINITNEIVIPKGECAKLSIDISEQSDNGANYTSNGIIKLKSGKIIFGYADKGGDMYTAQEFEAAGTYELSSSYLAKDIGEINDIQLFFFIPEQDVDTVFTIEELKSVKTNIETIKLEKDVISYGSFQ